MATKTKTQPTVKEKSNVVADAISAPLKTSDIEIVTSLNLRRKIVPAPCKRVSLFISDADYTELTMIGIKLNVTWDEVLRAAISQTGASTDPVSSLKNFILL